MSGSRAREMGPMKVQPRTSLCELTANSIPTAEPEKPLLRPKLIKAGTT